MIQTLFELVHPPANLIQTPINLIQTPINLIQTLVYFIKSTVCFSELNLDEVEKLMILIVYVCDLLI